ncbi:MAG: RNase adapter RapZ [Deltaproteobacteria bacterium]
MTDPALPKTESSSPSQRMVQTVVITGMSGSGKSTALKAFEDLGYFCVDNLPIVLLPEFLSFADGTARKPTKVALVMDVRESTFLDQYHSIFTQIKEDGYHVEILFLDAGDDVILRRFSQTRRPHPLMPKKGNILDAIGLERMRLACLKECSSRVLDTSAMNVHQLRQEIFSLYEPRKRLDHLVLHVLSFGFKYGVPPDASLVFDVRFLPNPYFDPRLRPFDGTSPQIRQYVLEKAETQAFLERFSQFLFYLIPQYGTEGKSYLVIAIGCTGGRHRSVVIADHVANLIAMKGSDVIVTHRDKDKET